LLKIIDQPYTIQPYFLQQAEICERHAKENAKMRIGRWVERWG